MITTTESFNTKHAAINKDDDWPYITCIQDMAAMAALLHDIGKSTKGFQKKLFKSSVAADPYRHEWISLKLFALIIQGCKTDKEWLERLACLPTWLCSQDIKKQVLNLNPDTPVIGGMPPLAQWVAWLIVTHHRLPPLKEVFLSTAQIERFIATGQLSELKGDLYEFYDQLKAVDYWVKNPKSLLPTSEGGAPQKQLKEFWQFHELVIHSPAWQQAVKVRSKNILNNATLMQLSQNAVLAQPHKPVITDPLLLHLSRLCLMIADHNYSSLKVGDERCIKIEECFSSLAANTVKSNAVDGDNSGEALIKQSLEEHLIGVAKFSDCFAQKLPKLTQNLPHLKNNSALSKPTSIERFKWQNNAFDLTAAYRQESDDTGFFGVNMASTGAGKTIGNARIMYALADPRKGARFTIALGLRVLTLQTGLSFRKNLKLQADQLAILVGGSANKKLFEMNYDVQTKEAVEIKKEVEADYHNQAFGSESCEELVDEFVDSTSGTNNFDELDLDVVISSPKTRDLLLSPVVVCTVDHLMQASECKRGGRYITPWLRLLSSDLILDEPDDFNQADLPALSRLVYLAGMLGSRILLSSATLAPDLVAGLFNAYLSGRHVFNKSHNKPAPKVVCAWFDEQPGASVATQCASTNEFYSSHDAFIRKRTGFLGSQPIRRQAQILQLDPPKYSKDTQETFYAYLAQQLATGAVALHEQNALTYPSTQKKISVGLVRIANVNNIVAICQQLFKPDKITVPPDTIVHVACYHAKQLLVLRNTLENKLDRILDRNNGVMPFEHNEVSERLLKNPDKHHIFMVVASPVSEVGRDHDYDWAIVEPSSMRSIVQLAGRIGRHRPEKVAKQPNMLLLQYNIRYLKHGGGVSPVFTRPGFETKNLKPVSYDLNTLMSKEQLSRIDATPCIASSLQDNRLYTQADSLAELEHLAVKKLMNNNQLNHVSAYYHPVTAANRVHTHLQQISPFRVGSQQQDWLFIPRELQNDEQFSVDSQQGPAFDIYYKEEALKRGLDFAGEHNKEFAQVSFDFTHPQVQPWLFSQTTAALRSLQRKQQAQALQTLAKTYASVSLESNKSDWCFHEYFGFYCK